MKSKKVKVLIRGLFLIYIALLIKVIFFKDSISVMTYTLKLPLKNRLISSNFIPMKTILFYLSGNTNPNIAIENILGNIIAFGPLGFLLPMLFRKIKKLKSVTIISFIISLAFELIQLLTGFGSFDVDDLLLNTFGAIGGYLIYKGINSFVYKKFNVNLNG